MKRNCLYTRNNHFIKTKSPFKREEKQTIDFTFWVKTFLRMPSIVPTLDLLQVKKVRASFLVGWTLGNGVKN